MKKIIILLLLLFGCSCNPVRSVRTDLVLLSGGSVITIDGTHLEKQIKSEQDFILYIGNESCINCSSILKLLNFLLMEENRIIYHIPYSDIDDSYYDRVSDLNLPKFRHYELPAFLLFQKGKVTERISYKKNFFSREWLIRNLKFHESKQVEVINHVNFGQWDVMSFQEIEDFTFYRSSVSVLCGSIFEKKVWNRITSPKEESLYIYFCEISPYKGNGSLPYVLHYDNGLLTDIVPL